MAETLWKYRLQAIALAENLAAADALASTLPNSGGHTSLFSTATALTPASGGTAVVARLLDIAVRQETADAVNAMLAAGGHPAIAQARIVPNPHEVTSMLAGYVQQPAHYGL